MEHGDDTAKLGGRVVLLLRIAASRRLKKVSEAAWCACAYSPHHHFHNYHQ
jgi:hypothetical protein